MVAGPCIQRLDCGHGRLGKTDGLLLRLYSDHLKLTISVGMLGVGGGNRSFARNHIRRPAYLICQDTQQSRRGPGPWFPR